MKTENANTAEEVLEKLFCAYPSVVQCKNEIMISLEILLSCWRSGRKLMVCGNGGSASDAEHIVGEMMKSFRFKRRISPEFAKTYEAIIGENVPDWLEGAAPALSLVSQTSLMTAFANDESAEGVFAQQVYGYGKAGDVLLCISTSGNSPNVVEAAKVARAMGILVVSLTGSRDSALSAMSDACIRVPSDKVYEVQEMHLPIYHALCAASEAELFEGIHD